MITIPTHPLHVAIDAAVAALRASPEAIARHGIVLRGHVLTQERPTFTRRLPSILLRLLLDEVVKDAIRQENTRRVFAGIGSGSPLYEACRELLTPDVVARLEAAAMQRQLEGEERAAARRAAKAGATPPAPPTAPPAPTPVAPPPTAPQLASPMKATLHGPEIIYRASPRASAARVTPSATAARSRPAPPNGPDRRREISQAFADARRGRP